MAAYVFVPRQLRPWKRAAPDLRIVVESLWPDPVDHADGNSDVGDLDRSAMQATREQQMGRLAPEERYSAGRIDGGSHDGTARSINPARQINRDNGYAPAVHRIDHG